MRIERRGFGSAFLLLAINPMQKDKIAKREGIKMKITVGEVLHIADIMRPNAVEPEMKLRFLNEVEAEVFDVLSRYVPRAFKSFGNVGARKQLGLDWESGGIGGAPADDAGEVERDGQGALAWDGNPLEMGEARRKEKPLWKLKPYLPTDHEAVLLLDSRFSGVYTAYIMAKIDFLEEESENYLNDSQMYAAEKDAFVSWLIRTHRHINVKTRGLL